MYFFTETVLSDLLSHTRHVNIFASKKISGDLFGIAQAEWPHLIIDKFTNGQLEQLVLLYKPYTGSLLSEEGVDLLREVSLFLQI